MKKFLFIVLLIAAPIAAIAQESFIQLPADSTGKKLRMRTSTQNATTVYSQGFFLDDGSGSGPLGINSNPIFVNFVAGATTAITASSLPLPTGAATETTLAGIKIGTDRIPTSPATDRATAASPFSVRLSDGAAFFDPRSIRALTSADVVTVTQSSGANLHVYVDAAPSTAVTNAGLSNIPADPAREGGNLAAIAGKDFATQTTLAAIKAKTDNIPADPSREGGVLATATKQDTGNTSLSTIVTNTTGVATAANQTTIDNDIKAAQPRNMNDGSGNALKSTNGAMNVTVVQTSAQMPALVGLAASNPLLRRAALQMYCSTNLCPPALFK